MSLIQERVRALMAERSSSAQVRAQLDGDGRGDRETWKQLADAELLGLMDPVELAAVMEELGRVLYVGPYLSTVVLAAQALAVVAEPEATAHWLPRIADGSVTATLAVPEDGGSWDPVSVRMRAEPVRGQWLLNGLKSFVVDGHTADLLLVVADSEDGFGLFAVLGDAPGLDRRRLDATDRTRVLSRVAFTDVPSERVSGHGDARDGLARAVRLAAVAFAAEQVGGAQRCLDMAVEHARTRVQFGHPVGAFQAVKHQLVDLLLVVEQARSAAAHAASVIEAPGSEAAVAAAVAGAYCSEAYTRAAKTCIQVHGGEGFRWDHDAHLHLRRAKSSELLLGTPARHRATLAGLLALAPKR